ncbi:hypothetical protein NKI88_01165 [Mesorhizobium sp. M0317]|uniref:hypothetical protein n=1 Tax=Mesorhizobium sp. M0317 TaxID=2956935 RepID=UPI003335C2B6
MIGHALPLAEPALCTVQPSRATCQAGFTVWISRNGIVAPMMGTTVHGIGPGVFVLTQFRTENPFTLFLECS